MAGWFSSYPRSENWRRPPTRRMPWVSRNGVSLRRGLDCLMLFPACREASSTEKCSACTMRTRWRRVDSSFTAASTWVFSLTERQRAGSQRRINVSTRTIRENGEKSDMMVSAEVLVSAWKDVTDLGFPRSVLPTECCSSVSASIYTL